MNKPGYDTIYAGAWWLCVVTLPFTIPVNSASIILLVVVWLAEGRPREKWTRLKQAPWIWPFLAFFFLHVVGVLYSTDVRAGAFEVEKKLSFLVLPLVAATGKPFSAVQVEQFKSGFIVSCLTIVIISLMLSITLLMSGPTQPPQNFDVITLAQFNLLNPAVAPGWEYLSYIQVGEWIDLHPAYFSMYLIFCIAILLQGILDGKRWLSARLSMIALFILFIVLLSSRMAIISMPFVVMYQLLINYPLKKSLPRLSAYAVFLLFTLGLIWINPVSRFRILQEPMHTSLLLNPDNPTWNSVRYRLLEWNASLHAASNSWLVGVGTGDGQQELAAYYTSFHSDAEKLGYNAHSQYLQTVLELGLLGVIALLLCLAPGLISLGQRNPVYTSFLLLVLMMCLTESLFARQKGIVFFTLFQSIFLRSSIAA